MIQVYIDVGRGRSESARESDRLKCLIRRVRGMNWAGGLSVERGLIVGVF